MQRILSLSMVVLGAIVFTSASFASGGYGGGGGGGRGGFSGGNQRPTPSRSDPAYDRGKAVYSGRSRSSKGLRVCLSSPGSGERAEGKTVSLSRKNLKAFKGENVRALTDQLVDCSNHGVKAQEALSGAEFSALVHYLNKRFRLKLDS